MFKSVFITCSAVLAFSATAADAQKLDKNGRCHAANGQFAKAEVCSGMKNTTTTTTAMTPAATTTTKTASSTSDYKLDAKGNCHGPKGKMAKKEMCATM